MALFQSPLPPALCASRRGGQGGRMAGGVGWAGAARAHARLRACSGSWSVVLGAGVLGVGLEDLGFGLVLMSRVERGLCLGLLA